MSQSGFGHLTKINKDAGAASLLQGDALTKARWPATLRVELETPKGTKITREVTIREIWQDEWAFKARAMGLAELVFDAVYEKVHGELPALTVDLVHVGTGGKSVR